MCRFKSFTFCHWWIMLFLILISWFIHLHFNPPSPSIKWCVMLEEFCLGFIFLTPFIRFLLSLSLSLSVCLSVSNSMIHRVDSRATCNVALHRVPGESSHNAGRVKSLFGHPDSKALCCSSQRGLPTKWHSKQTQRAWPPSDSHTERRDNGDDTNDDGRRVTRVTLAMMLVVLTLDMMMMVVEWWRRYWCGGGRAMMMAKWLLKMRK